MKQKAEALHTILQNYHDCVIFLHNTREPSVADKIISEGFIFENQLSHTTDRINPSELVEIAYFMFQRKEYGPYTIVIAIPRRTYSLYTRYSNQFDIPIEELMSKVRPWMGENDEMTYTLAPEHIAGHFNNNTLEFRVNRFFNPDYISYRDRDEF
ncbi:MAG: hypothetical protein RBS37_04335 [Bacteroidales bacterium]|jgi:hypothetical protein|nr:hypothetical protein [Bacteroidales bacterium]